MSGPKQELDCVVPFFVQFGRELQQCFFREDGIPSISLVFEHSLMVETDEISLILVPGREVEV